MFFYVPSHTTVKPLEACFVYEGLYHLGYQTWKNTYALYLSSTNVSRIQNVNHERKTQQVQNKMFLCVELHTNAHVGT